MMRRLARIRHVGFLSAVPKKELLPDDSEALPLVEPERLALLEADVDRPISTSEPDQKPDEDDDDTLDMMHP